MARLRAAQDVICSTMQLYGNDYANIRPSEITSQCRRLKAQHGLDLVVIDYIQLMTSDLFGRNSSRQEEVQNITRSLKLMAKELNVPVIALSQLKRDAEIRNIKGEKGASEPVLSDLRESGAIEQGRRHSLCSFTKARRKRAARRLTALSSPSTATVRQPPYPCIG